MTSRQTQSTANHPQAEPFSDADWSRITNGMNLSGRQAEVMQLLLQGLCDKQIAKALRISYHTLRTHMRTLLSRQNVDTRLKLVVRAYDILREAPDAPQSPGSVNPNERGVEGRRFARVERSRSAHEEGAGR